MNEWQIGEMKNKGTAVIHHGPEWFTESKASQSAFFEEAQGQPKITGRPFSLFFGPTSALSSGPLDLTELEPKADSGRTPLISEQTKATSGATWHLSAKGPVDDTDSTFEDAAARQNEIRITLLARKYVSKDQFSSEERARLAIATERVRQLMPAVTSAEFDVLSNVLGQLKDLQVAGNQLRIAIHSTGIQK